MKTRMRGTYKGVKENSCKGKGKKRAHKAIRQKGKKGLLEN